MTELDASSDKCGPDSGRFVATATEFGPTRAKLRPNLQRPRPYWVRSPNLARDGPMHGFRAILTDAVLHAAGYAVAAERHLLQNDVQPTQRPGEESTAPMRSPSRELRHGLCRCRPSSASHGMACGGVAEGTSARIVCAVFSTEVSGEGRRQAALEGDDDERKLSCGRRGAFGRVQGPSSVT